LHTTEVRSGSPARWLLAVHGIFGSGGNLRTLAAFVAVAVGRPAWFFIFELTVLNAVLIGVTIWRARRNQSLTRAMVA
jgi:hypothetical protein